MGMVRALEFRRRGAVALLSALAALAATGGTERTVRADAGGLVLRTASLAPGDLIAVPGTQTLPGFSFAAGIFSQFGFRPGAAGLSQSYAFGADVLLGASLFGFVQFDAALPLRLDFADLPNGPTTIAGAVDGVRLGARLGAPWLVRAPGASGLGAALLFHVDLPTAYPEPQPLWYRPALAVDLQLGPLLLAAYTAVPFSPADGTSPLAVRVAHGGAAVLRLCRDCGLSVSLALDGTIAAAGPLLPGGRWFVEHGIAEVRFAVPRRRWNVRLFFAMPLDRLEHGEFVAGLGLSWDFGAARDAHGTAAIVDATVAASESPPETGRLYAGPPQGADGEAELARLASELLVIRWKAERVADWFAGEAHRPAYDLLLAHIDRMADYLDEATETEPPSPVLLGTVDVGVRAADIALDLMALDHFARNERPPIRTQKATNLVLEEFLWPLMRGLEDPTWAFRPCRTSESFRTEAARLLAHAEGHKRAIHYTFDASAAGNAGVTAASLVSSALATAKMVAALPETIVAAESTLKRVLAWLGERGGGGSLGVATGPGGIRIFVSVGGTAARAETLVLSEAEIAALVRAGALSMTIGQLYFAAPAGFGGAGASPGGGGASSGSVASNSTSKNARELRKAMEREHAAHPGDPTYDLSGGKHAHHLVPGKLMRGLAERGRALLKQCGFSINHAVNGVAARPGFHTGLKLHSAAGINTVVNSLQAAFENGGCNEMVSELRSIAREINAGTFKVVVR